MTPFSFNFKQPNITPHLINASNRASAARQNVANAQNRIHSAVSGVRSAVSQGVQKGHRISHEIGNAAQSAVSTSHQVAGKVTDKVRGAHDSALNTISEVSTNVGNTMSGAANMIGNLAFLNMAQNATTSMPINSSSTTGPVADIPIQSDSAAPPEATTGTMTIEQQQQNSDSTMLQNQNEFLEPAVDSGQVMFDVAQETNYNVESIIEWAARPHRLDAFVLAETYYLNQFSLIKRIMKGKFDFFRYLRYDMEFTMRWNVPKTTYGYFFFLYNMGTDFDPTNYAEWPGNYVPIKQLVNIQEGMASLLAPFHYPFEYLDLNGDHNFNIGAFQISFPSVRTVTDFLPEINITPYVRLLNVSLVTPIGKSLLPQGAFLSTVGKVANVGAGVGGLGLGIASTVMAANMYQADGQHAIRTFSEALNFMRQDGIDPSIPSSRVNVPLSKIPDNMSFDDYHDVCAIPSYVTVDITNGTAFNPQLPILHRWMNLIRNVHPMVRCDFRVTLSVFASPFHTGRLRIVYANNDSALISPADDAVIASYSPAIIMDIQDSNEITFIVPYGSQQDFNNFPRLSIFPEVNFTSPFTLAVKPYMVLAITCENISVMGLKMPDPRSRLSRWVESILPPSAAAPMPEANEVSFPIVGWVNTCHTSDDMTNTSFTTLARRPGLLYDVFPPTGPIPQVYNVSNPYIWPIRHTLGNNSLTTGDPTTLASYIMPFIQCFSGFRGSIKVSVRWVSTTTTDVIDKTFELQPVYFAGDVNSACPGAVFDAYGEIQLPYMTTALFYAQDKGQLYPAVKIIPRDSGANFNAYLSFYDDFSLIMPCSPKMQVLPVLSLKS